MTLGVPKILSGLSAAERAEAIYRISQSEVRSRLWSAALGATERPEGSTGAPANRGPINLLDMLSEEAKRSFEGPAQPQRSARRPSSQAAIGSPVQSSREVPFGSPLDAQLAVKTAAPAPSSAGLNLGTNSLHIAAIEAASRRTGIAPAALAAIIDAEAAKLPDGRWNPSSRNPRSSATGLTQFLSSTWEGEAERPGTFLNTLARANGWLNGKGQVKGENRAELLRLRLDARCSIEAAADYAKANVQQFKRAGVKVSEDPSRFAQLAYLGHHLGAGDAIDYLTGGVDAARARKLLCAQIGTKEAGRRIQAAGCPATAHRNWLSGFIGSKIDISKFTAQA